MISSWWEHHFIHCHQKVAPKLYTPLGMQPLIATEATIWKQRIKMSAMACECDNRPTESRRRIAAQRDYYSKSPSSRSGTNTCSCSSSLTNVGDSNDREKDICSKTPLCQLNTCHVSAKWNFVFGVHWNTIVRNTKQYIRTEIREYFHRFIFPIFGT